MKVSDIFDESVLAKYNNAGPRYTSYPTAVSFHSDFTEDDFDMALRQNKDASKGLSLYLHIPFCHSLCYYCGCNKLVTRNQDKIDKYLDYLIQEIQLRSQQLSDYCVDHIHFGGGTPSFLSATQLAKLLIAIHQHYSLSTQLEQSIEIDPRRIELSYIDELFALNFTRLSIGVQDVNLAVQEKINRVQDTQFIVDLVQHAHYIGFDSVNIDLIYGLPGQTFEGMQATLAQVALMDPDRISLFSYAHMPQLFSAQRKIKDGDLPDAKQKLALFRQATDHLVQQGYQFIGMDHFAKPKDELSKALENKSLGRNFQGYTTDTAGLLVGFGVSSISNLGNAYSQNVKKLKDYYLALDNIANKQKGNQASTQTDHKLIEKGVSLSHQDEIHRALIHQIMCNLYVDKLAFGREHNIDFNTYFENNLASLGPLEADNLLSNTEFSLTVHPRGRLLVRNICMNFDAYLSSPAHQMRYSRVI